MPAFDREATLAGVGDDQDLLRQVVAAFCAESPRMLAEIKKSVEDRDPKALARAAHTLKGSVGTFGKGESFKVAEALEQSGLSQKMDGAQAQYLALEQLILDLERDLNGFCG